MYWPSDPVKSSEKHEVTLFSLNFCKHFHSSSIGMGLLCRPELQWKKPLIIGTPRDRVFSSTISVVSYISSTIDRVRGPKYACHLSVVSYTRVPFKRLPRYLGSKNLQNHLGSANEVKDSLICRGVRN